MNFGFDFDAAVAAPFRAQQGLRRLAPGAAQLTPMAPGSRHQREKLAVLSAFPERALVAEEDFDAAPALRELMRHAASEHPDAWRWDGRRAAAPLLGVAVEGEVVCELAKGAFGLGDELARCLRGVPGPQRLIGLIALAFVEDLAIVDGATGRIRWIAACLPSRWAPQDKVGRHFSAVHAPVADNALLVRADDHLMRMARGPERWERFVWNVTWHPRLHAHPLALDESSWPDDAFDDARDPRAWFRSERQTFIAVPEAGQVVSTTGVDSVPLARAIGTVGRAARLHDAVASMCDAVLDCRGLSAVREPLLRWLAARAQA